MPITLNEFIAALNATKSNSSPGLDQINYTMLKNSPDSLLNILVSTINYYIRHNIYPLDWKNYLIILLPKENPKKFRPIAFSSCVLKNLYFKIDNQLEGPYKRSFGVPQGNILSPLLYNIYTANIKGIIKHPTEISQYADDTILLYKTNDIQEGITHLENELKNIKAYFQSLNLELCPEKTKLIIFSKENYQNLKKYTLSFNDTTLTPLNSVKYLGLIMDHKLLWTLHINYIIGKAINLTNTLKSLRNTWWGENPHLLLTIYKTLIRSTIEYNLFLTDYSNNKNLNKLRIIENNCIRMAMGYRISTALNVIHGESNINYLSTRLKLLPKKFLLKTLNLKNHTLVSDLNSLKNELALTVKYHINNKYTLLQALEDVQMVTKNIIKKTNLPLPYEYNYNTLLYNPDIDTTSGIALQKSKSPQTTFNEIISKQEHNYTAIFTDGSKIPNATNTGLAMYIPQTKSQFLYKINPKALIFTAESLAILLAIIHISKYKAQHSYIYSDSKSALEAIQNFSPMKKNTTSYLTLDILSQLYIAKKRGLNIKLMCIPAHINIANNEKVDTLAKQATTTGASILLDLPYTPT
ncbi:hypothetical protein TKK_0002263 [Trichogramma kaykai]